MTQTPPALAGGKEATEVSYEHTRSACEKILALKGVDEGAHGQFRDEVGYALLNLAKAIETDLSRISSQLAELRKATQKK